LIYGAFTVPVSEFWDFDVPIYFSIMASYGLTVLLLWLKKKIGWYVGMAIFGVVSWFLFGYFPTAGFGGVILGPIFLANFIALLFLLADYRNYFAAVDKAKAAG
jgi:hypothetical protein